MMRKRRLRTNNHPRQNLDSFLDILTNTVGVLMFIGLFVSLLAVETGIIIRTPLQSETRKIGKFFEVRNNEIFYISDPQLEREINQAVANLPRCSEPNIPENIPNYLYSFYIGEVERYERCINNRNLKLQSFNYDNDSYTISFTAQGSLKYEAHSFSRGSTIEDIRDDNAEYNDILQRLDPQLHYVAFIVRPDSFSAFRTARQEAWNSGYEVGWEPFAQDRTLVFGSSGRSIGVQ